MRKDILINQSEIGERLRALPQKYETYEIKEGVIMKMDIKTKWAVGNMVMIEMNTTLGLVPNLDDHTKTCGYFLKCLMDVLFIDEHINRTIKRFENAPARFIVTDHVVGVGHHSKDKFFLFEDLNEKRGEHV